MINKEAMAQAQARWDSVAKPLSSLGLLEDIVVQLAGISGSADVNIDKRCVIVMCADNGVVAEGVSQSGSEVTAIVARNMADGTANVNAMARVAKADVIVCDIGMAEVVSHQNVRQLNVARGSRNFAVEPAMTYAECERAIERGMDEVRAAKDSGYRLVLTGEMGIGNTTTSAAVASALLGVDVELMTGRGAGLSSEGLRRKIDVIKRGLALHEPDRSDPIDVMCKVGGFDIAGLCGVFLGGHKYGMPVVLDGFISGVAALAASLIEPDARRIMIASHMSREPASARILDALGLEPAIRAGLALGEGTGAVALLPLIDMALAVYNQDHTFENIEISAYERFST